MACTRVALRQIDNSTDALLPKSADPFCFTRALEMPFSGNEVVDERAGHFALFDFLSIAGPSFAKQRTDSFFWMSFHWNSQVYAPAVTRTNLWPVWMPNWLIIITDFFLSFAHASWEMLTFQCFGYNLMASFRRSEFVITIPRFCTGGFPWSQRSRETS